MPVTWKSEACDQRPDPESGASIVRLTQSARHSINIYGEQPYSSPDGKRIAIMRSEDADPRFAPHDLYVADLQTLRIQAIERNCQSYFIGTSGWSGILYYLNAERQLMRLDIATLKREAVWKEWPFPVEFGLHSVSAGQRYLVGVMLQADFETAIIRIDLSQQTWTKILEGPELFGGHLQYAPQAGPDGKFVLMGIAHRGKKLNNQWQMLDIPARNPGACYYQVDNDGHRFQLLSSGEPIVPSNNGHSAWVGNTGRICFSVSWDRTSNQLDPRWPDGNLFTVTAGDAKPMVFRAPEHRFNHVSVSKCGRYFLCDSYPKGIPGPIPLVVGNFKNGKYRSIITDCKATCGGPACSHPHPYFTADNRYVIYTADPFELGQVYAARVPEGFLESLE